MLVRSVANAACVSANNDFVRFRRQFKDLEDRLLMTGLHTVRDVFCASCSSLLGWKYDFAYEQSQKYKEGKFIVEKAMVLHEGGW